MVGQRPGAVPLAYQITQISITDVNGGYWRANTFDHVHTGRWAGFRKRHLTPLLFIAKFGVSLSLAVAATTTTTTTTNTLGETMT